VVLIYMDDASYKELNQPYIGQWDRSLHARLLRRLTQEKARAVVFDIVFSDANPNRPAADQELASAIRENGKVVLAGDYVPVPSGYGMQKANMFVPPAEIFERAAAGTGMSQLDQSADFVVREHRHGWPGEPIQSLTWATAKLLGARVTNNPREQFTEKWVNYYGPPRTLTSCSYVEALDSEVVQRG